MAAQKKPVVYCGQLIVPSSRDRDRSTCAGAMGYGMDKSKMTSYHGRGDEEGESHVTHS
ncbi:hypothetical protein J6590_016417 [Homalodisca vitripennis]|nr:hypothetical protein J6590_016417 [Homalodisca vitripennis]